MKHGFVCPDRSAKPGGNLGVVESSATASAVESLQGIPACLLSRLRLHKGPLGPSAAGSEEN
jgi:hypothetical protein